MGFRMRKSFKITPGIKLNLGSKSMGLSVGTKGCRTSFNTKTGMTSTIGIPGTGLSYSTRHKNVKSKSYTRNNELQKLRKQQEQLNELENNKLAVDLFENSINMIREIHKEVDTPTDWVNLANTILPLNVESGEKGYYEKEAIEILNNFKPSFMEKLSGKAVKRQDELENEVLRARDKDVKEYNYAKRAIGVAKRILTNDLDAYLEAIDIAKPLDDLLEFGSGFEFFIENNNQIEVDFQVNSKNVVPEEKLILTKTGKLSSKKMSKSEHFDIEQDYVCSCAIRIARDMFALLPINIVIVNAQDIKLDSTMGIYNEETILSVKFERSKLASLNMDLIDPSDSLINFEHNMKFKKTSGFSKVEKLLVYQN